MTAAKITYELPTACSQAAQWSTRFPPLGNHHCGDSANMTAPAAAIAKQRRPGIRPAPPGCPVPSGCPSLSRRRSRIQPRQPRIASVSTAISPHTQWCDHEMGEISRPASAFRDSAQASADAAKALRMPRQASATTTADRTSHVAVPAGECGSRPARASTP
jgi:hypothetical protein